MYKEVMKSSTSQILRKELKCGKIILNGKKSRETLSSCVVYCDCKEVMR